MSQPSKPSFLDFKIDTCAPSLLIQVVVGNFVGPEDVADPLQTAVVKGIDFVYVPFDNSPEFTAIQLHAVTVHTCYFFVLNDFIVPCHYH